LAYNAPKSFGGRALPGPAGGTHSTPPDSLAGFRGRRGEKGKGREGKKEAVKGKGMGRKGRGKGEGKGKRGIAYTKWGRRPCMHSVFYGKVPGYLTLSVT